MANGNSRPTEMNYAEFFAGIGLMRLGLEAADWKIAFANDIDPQKEEMYTAQFQDAEQHFLLGDIHDLSPTDIPTVALATASFPCNDLSLAGSRDGLQGKNSSAFWGFINILKKMRNRRPPLVLIENVVGFLTSHDGRDLEDAMLALNDLGYSVDPFIIDASWFVPQSRQRLFVVGLRSRLFEPEVFEGRFWGKMAFGSRRKFVVNFRRSQFAVSMTPLFSNGLANCPDWRNN